MSQSSHSIFGIRFSNWRSATQRSLSFDLPQTGRAREHLYANLDYGIVRDSPFTPATHKLLWCPMQSPINAGEAKSRNFKRNATPISVGAPARPNACISAARGLAWHVVGGVKRLGVYPSQHYRTKHHPVSGSVSIAVLAVFVWRGGHVATTVASRLECLSAG